MRGAVGIAGQQHERGVVARLGAQVDLGHGAESTPRPCGGAVGGCDRALPNGSRQSVCHGWSGVCPISHASRATSRIGSMPGSACSAAA